MTIMDLRPIEVLIVVTPTHRITLTFEGLRCNRATQIRALAVRPSGLVFVAV